MPLFDRFKVPRANRPPRKALAIAKACRNCGQGLPAVARFCFACGQAVTEGDQSTATGSVPAELRDRLAQALEGRYDVQHLLGSGGMGAVFLAEDLTLERQVAIKVLPPELSADQGVVQRFKREAKTAAKLDHPHIIPIHRVESEAGLHYIVMKLIPGSSLESVLSAGAPLPLPDALRVLSEAASALGHAHRHGVVHRDVKPANIMLDADERVVLTDFGISKLSREGQASTQLTQSGAVIGTPHYMAPEQALGHPVDGRADQYALAVVGFQMLTGTLPFDGESPHAIIHRHINHAPPRVTPLRPDTPGHVEMAIARAMSKAPSHRFASMEEFVGALSDASLGAAVTGSLSRFTPARLPPPPAVVEPTEILSAAGGTRPAPARRRMAKLALLTVAALVVAAGVLGATGKLSRKPSKPRAMATRTAARTAAAPKPVQVARLSVTATPSAAVYIDGKRVGMTPLSGHPLAIGRTYQLRIERRGYRPRKETLAVAGTKAISRRYVLERVRR